MYKCTNTLWEKLLLILRSLSQGSLSLPLGCALGASTLMSGVPSRTCGYCADFAVVVVAALIGPKHEADERATDASTQGRTTTFTTSTHTTLGCSNSSSAALHV